ncbi:MAG: hypothetical protein U5L08_07325 [Xanthomonadales bacterium]|nr:hypothetical protein [Xanthomonadales bacterium]
MDGRRSFESDLGETNRAADVLCFENRHLPGWLRLHSRGSGRCVRIEILERLTLALDFEGRECAWLWQPARGKELRIRKPPGLLRPLEDPNALALLGQSRVETVVDRGHCRMPTLHECQEAMRYEIARNPELRNWAADWHRLLNDLLGPALELSERSSMTPGGDIRIEHFQRVWWRQAAFSDVESNAPGLLPLLNLWLASGLEPEHRGPVLSTLKRLVCECTDCGPATWRWLLRWGADPLLNFAQAAAANDEPCRQWQVLCSVLGLWTRASLPPPLPPALARAWGRREARRSTLTDYCPERVAIFARHLSENPPALCADELADQLIRLRKPCDRPDSNQKRSGWKWLKRELQHLSSNIPCSAPTLNALRRAAPAEMTVSGVRFANLSSPAEIFEEGQRLDHCMADYPLRIARSGDLHYSLRHSETGERLGTLSIQLSEESLSLKELAGPGNSRPSPMMRTAALALCRALVGTK